MPKLRENNPYDFYCYLLLQVLISHMLAFDKLQYLVQSAVDGYNVCIFAYGQTGSGKTFTIYGSENNPGLTPRAISELFRIIKRDSTKYSFSLKVSSFCLPQSLPNTL
jgi:predicted oxidoreductase